MKRKRHGDQKLIIKIMLMIVVLVLVIAYKVSSSGIIENQLAGVEAEVAGTLLDKDATHAGSSASEVIAQNSRKPVNSYTISIDETASTSNLTTKIATKEETDIIKSALVSGGILTGGQANSIDHVVIAIGDTSNVKETTVHTGYSSGSNVILVTYDSNAKTYSYISGGTTTEDGSVSYAVNGSTGTTFAKAGTSGSISPIGGDVIVINDSIEMPEDGKLFLTLLKGHTYKVIALADYKDVTGTSTINCSNSNCVFTESCYLYAAATGSCEITGIYQDVNQATISCKIVDTIADGQSYQLDTREAGEYYVVKWDTALSKYGQFLGEEPTLTYQVTDKCCYKRLVYTNEYGEKTYASPYEATEIHIKKGSSITWQMYSSYEGSYDSMIYNYGGVSRTAWRGRLISFSFVPPTDTTIKPYQDGFVSGGASHSWHQLGHKFGFRLYVTSTGREYVIYTDGSIGYK